MADVKTKECDMRDCAEQGPDVLRMLVQVQRVKTRMDLCREHRRPVIETVERSGAAWAGRTAPDAMALAAGQLIVDL
jgi:hypothetical protein